MSRTDSAADPEWTIDELASIADLPTRTIREYRTVGVLAPPEKRGRVGIYGREHLERLRLIGRLQARGYSLAGIRDLLQAWAEGSSLGSVLALDEPGPTALDETPVAMTSAELTAALPALVDPEVLTRALQVGLVGETPDGYAVRSPALLRLVADAVAAGSAVEPLFEFVAAFRDGATAQAEALTQLVIDQLWDPDADPATMESMARRSRLLIAQAAASMVVHQLGEALLAAGETREGRGVDALASAVRIGVVS